MNLVKLKDFVAVNIETTGLNPETNGIIHFCAVKVIDEKIVDSFNTYIKSELPVPENVSKITGITNDMLKNAPSIDDVMSRFLSFAEKLIPLSYNTQFDISFINKYLQEKNLPQYKEYIDMLDFVYEKLPTLRCYKLSNLYRELGIEETHNLLEETMAIVEMYQKLCKKKYNAIFLDVDGVINNEHTKTNMHPYLRIDNKLVQKLAQIVYRSNSAIYLISDWKDYWEKTDKKKQDECADFLDYMLSCERIKIADKVAGSSFERGKNIKEFLQKHDIDNFAILDDIEFDYIDEGLSKNYIQIDSKKGLTDEDVEKALEILNG